MANQRLNKEIRELEKAYTTKYGDDCVLPTMQIRKTALNSLLIEKMMDELLKCDSFIDISQGSNFQEKKELNPLIAAIDKAQRTYTQQLQALGLNQLANKKEDVNTQTNENDPLLKFLQR